MRASALPLLFTLPFMSGCLLLIAEPACPNEGFSADGTLVFDGQERSPVLDNAWLETDPTGSCLTSVFGTMEFGQGCTLSFEADGDTDTLAVFDVSVFGGEGCGLPEGNWRTQDLGDSTVTVDYGAFGIGDDDSVCFDGTLTVSLDLVLEDDGETVAVSGEASFDGIEKAHQEPRTCAN